MTSIDRTAYPRLKRKISGQGLREAFSSPTLAEMEWARELADSDESLLSLTVWLRYCQRLGCFPLLANMPEQVIAHTPDELDRAVRTVVFLRSISDGELCAHITRATNMSESFPLFSKGSAFGYDVIADNEPEAQEEMIKFTTLVADLIRQHTAIDMSAALNHLRAEGHPVHRPDVAAMAPLPARQHPPLRRLRLRPGHPSGQHGYPPLSYRRSLCECQ